MRRARRGALATVLLLAATLVPLGVLAGPASAASSSAAQSLVEVTYSDFLDVPPNPNSLAYWSARVAAGSSSQASFVAYVADSKDAVIEEVSRLYYSLLGRRPFGSSLHARVVAIQNHTSTLALQAEQLYASGEYLARVGGTTASWVTAVYRSILGRVPSPSAAAERQAQVGSHGRQYVATVLYSSLEARARRVQGLYRRELHRAASGGSLAHWEAVDATSGGDAAVAKSLADSAEYAVVAQHRTAVVISRPYLKDITVGQPAGVLATEAATGGSGPYTWSVLGLPSSLHAVSTPTVARIDGDLSAGPTSGPYPVTSIVTDAYGDMDVLLTQLNLVLPAGVLPLSLPNPTTLGYSTGSTIYGIYRVGVAVHDHLVVQGGIAPYTVSFSGTLPHGLSLGADGTLSGTPLAAGAGALEVTVTDAVHSTFTGAVSVLVAAPDAQPLTSVTDVLADGGGACAITGGHVDCWGGSYEPSTVGTYFPTQVPGLTGATKLALGIDPAGSGRSFCAITTGGGVSCGFGPAAAGSGATTVPGLSGVVDIETDLRAVSGPGTSCALTSAGRVLCWGSNADGMLGAGFDPSIVAGSATPVDTGLSGMTQLYAREGNDTPGFCALGSGQLWCWGTNGGMIGDATAVDAWAPVHLPSFSSVTAFSGSCAVDAGNLWCWGPNYNGDVGNGTTDPVLYPFEVPGLSDVTTLTANGRTTCAVGTVAGTPGTLECWGQLWTAATSYPGDAYTMVSQPSPTVVPGLSNVTAVSFTEMMICAVADPTATVYCWDAFYPGNGVHGFTSTPVSTGLTGVVSLHGVNTNTACAEKADTTWWCWGDDGMAAGAGVVGPAPSPSELVDGSTSAPLSGLAAFSDGFALYGRMTDGRLYGWGEDEEAGVGDGYFGNGPGLWVTRPKRI